MNTTTIPLVDVLTERFGINRIFEIQPSNTESGHITDLEFKELLEYIYSTLQSLYPNNLHIPDFVNDYSWRWLSTSGELDFDSGTWSHNYGNNLIPLVHKEGKLLKRIRAALKNSNNKLNLQMRIRNPNTGYWDDYIPLKVEVPNNVMGLWGDKLKEIVARNNQFFCAFETDLIDGWKPGDFGDSGSCYWDSDMYEKARYALSEYPGAFAIKFYNSHHVGEGRAWVVPHPDIPNSLVMFNVYPRSNSKYTYNSTGTVMSYILQSVLPDTKYVCTKTDMNEMGILYINNGCLVVHPDSASLNSNNPVRLHDLEIPEHYNSRHYTHCHDCNDRLSEDETYTDERGYDFCESCYDSRYFHCTHCNEETRRNDAILISDELYCEDCANSQFSYCEHCESYVDTSDYNTTTNMCDDCTRDNFTVCDVCDTYISNDEILNVQSVADTYHYNVCQDCHDDHLCSSCGSFNYSYNPNRSDICVHCPTLEGIE